MIPFLLYLLLRRFSTRSVVIGNLRHTFSLSFKERVRGEVIYNNMNIHWYDSDQSILFLIGFCVNLCRRHNILVASECPDSHFVP